MGRSVPPHATSATTTASFTRASVSGSLGAGPRLAEREDQLLHRRDELLRLGVILRTELRDVTADLALQRVELRAHAAQDLGARQRAHLGDRDREQEPLRRLELRVR